MSVSPTGKVDRSLSEQMMAMWNNDRALYTSKYEEAMSAVRECEAKVEKVQSALLVLQDDHGKTKADLKAKQKMIDAIDDKQEKMATKAAEDKSVLLGEVKNVAMDQAKQEQEIEGMKALLGQAMAELATLKEKAVKTEGMEAEKWKAQEEVNRSNAVEMNDMKKRDAEKWAHQQGVNIWTIDGVMQMYKEEENQKKVNDKQEKLNQDNADRFAWLTANKVSKRTAPAPLPTPANEQ